MSLRSSLLRLPDHPCSTTALTSCPASSRLSGRGTHSSSRSRTTFCHFTPELQGSDCLLPRDTREVIQELVERVTSLEIVIQRLHRHPRADEDRSPSEDL